MPGRAAELRALAVVAALSGAPAAQSPPDARVHVAFAAAPQRNAVPALAWLCEQHLPQQRAWPADLDPRRPFALTLTADGVAIAPTAVELPRDVAASGTCEVGGGPALTFRCASDGSEDWFVPAGFVLPAAWRRVVEELDGMELGVPRTVNAAVLAGHVVGGLADGDPRATVLRVGAAACGDVTWFAWSTPDHVRVRGRSDGGLTFPAALLLLAAADGPRTHGLSLRAFAARDADRVEAARQLVRADETDALPALRALLCSDDRTRLAAIDALVRLGAADELPGIVAAGGAAHPWASLAATDAVRMLWQDASPEARRRVNMAIAGSDSVLLRSLPTHSMATRPPSPPPPLPDGSAGGAQVRALVWLGLIAVFVLGLLARERARLRARSD